MDRFIMLLKQIYLGNASKQNTASENGAWNFTLQRRKDRFAFFFAANKTGTF